MIRLLFPAAILLATLVPTPPAAASDLSCDGDRECLRFIGEAGGSRIPAKGGARETVNAGRVQLELTPWELERERQCLAIAAYAEARDQGAQGMQAVMWVILNRVEREMNGAERPCDVVAQPAVLEALSRPEYGKQLRAIRRGAVPPLVRAETYPDEIAFRGALLLAYRALGAGESLADDPTRSATHYWCPKLQKKLGRAKPDWAKRYVRTAKIGDHVFYRLPLQVAEAR